MGAEFEGRRIVVTGGAGALGTAVVRALLDRGGECFVPCVTQKEFDGFELKGHERVRAEPDVDLTEERVAQRYYADAGPIWGSVHCAGGFAMGKIGDVSLGDLEKMLAMNVRTCFLSCREAVGAIRAAQGEGGGDGGRIVNVAAEAALRPTGGMTHYTLSKAAVAALTRDLGEELKGERIWVNAVAPSIMDTPANREAMPKADHGAWPSVEAVARTIVYLASPENGSARGAVVTVGGRS